MSKAALTVLVLVLAEPPPGRPALPRVRVTPVEALATSFPDRGTGSSGVAGIRTKVLAGDPAGGGLYSILLFVPPHTTIAAHSHPDERIANVVSGEWRIGYGSAFDEASLKVLPPGSVYTEPAGAAHFARTDSDAVIVQITGSGPTDTRYVNPAEAPTSPQP